MRRSRKRKKKILWQGPFTDIQLQSITKNNNIDFTTSYRMYTDVCVDHSARKKIELASCFFYLGQFSNSGSRKEAFIASILGWGLLFIANLLPFFEKVVFGTVLFTIGFMRYPHISLPLSA